MVGVAVLGYELLYFMTGRLTFFTNPVGVFAKTHTHTYFAKLKVVAM